MKRVKNAELWFVQKQLRHDTHQSLDQALCLFFDFLAEQKEEPTIGAYTVYGFQLLRCSMPTNLYLPNAKQQLAVWRRKMPGGIRLGVAEKIADECCLTAVENGDIEFALAAQLELDTYFRPTEVLTLRAKQITPPSKDTGAPYQKWVATLAPSEEKGRTKTGLTDACVVVGDNSRKWLKDALALWMSNKSGEAAVFPGLSLKNFEETWKRLLVQKQYPLAFITPHVLRHTAASNDIFHGRRDLAGVQKRGFWESRKSVARYGKEAHVLKSWHKIPAMLHGGIRSRAKALPNILLTAIHTHMQTQ
jgi:integrase